MPLDTDFIRFSREMKPTKQCKISQKIYGQDRGGAVAPPPPPLKYATESAPSVTRDTGYPPIAVGLSGVFDLYFPASTGVTDARTCSNI